MRCIARQGARFAGKGRVLAPSQTHVPQRIQLRGFRHNVRFLVENRGQPPSADRADSLNGRTEEQKACEQDAAPVKKEGETVEGEATEVASNDGTHKLKGKTFRQRRKEAQASNNVPKPPPLPDWFLQHNVKLHVETVKPDRRAESARELRCVDTVTGQSLFTLPYYEAWPVPGLIPESGNASETSSEPPMKKGFEQNYFDHKFNPLDKDGRAWKLEPQQDDGGTRSQRQSKDVNPHTLLRWAILQAETGVRAAFSIASNAPNASSQAASRLDLSLFCKDADSHMQMDDLVEDLAALSGAHLIRLDANDLAELAADYVGQGTDSPGSFANLAYDVFGGYASQTSSPARRAEENEDEAFDEDEMDEDESAQEETRNPAGMIGGVSFSLENIRKTLMNRRTELQQALGRIGPSDIIVGVDTRFQLPSSPMRPSEPREDHGYDTARLTSLLEQILDAPKSDQGGTLQRRFNVYQLENNTSKNVAKVEYSYQAFWRMWHSSAGCWRPDAAGWLATQAQNVSGLEIQGPSTTGMGEAGGSGFEPSLDNPPCTILHVRDLRDVMMSRMGESIIRRLVSLVRKRRRAGERVVLVGTSCCDASGFVSMPQGLDEFRTVSVPAVFQMTKHDQAEFKPSLPANDNDRMPPYGRILEINLRHVQRMLHSLRPSESIELFTESAQRQLRFGDDILGKKVMSFGMIQRIVLTAIGLSEVHAVAAKVNASHIGLATMITRQAAQLERDWSDYRQKDLGIPFTDTNRFEPGGHAPKAMSIVEKIKKDLNPYESKLSNGVVDASNIKAGFDQVHAPPETIEALKTMSSLSLLRPDAFKYGVLAADRLPGLMLYGPPGTGKTLLAKAVAKESGSTVLEVSGAQIYEKYVGEGEKMARAVFSLAKKLSPCIVFIDEADAIFGTRSSAGNRNTHREIINQFLREWDGMDSHDVFIMVASNRPFDLDDAVLRRLPRRLLVDLPVAKDRESILKIHLNDEVLDSTVDLAKLAADTPLYSGSDLKNLCVSAALACVREELDLSEARKKSSEKFEFPEKRTLSVRHFEKAIKEISASISEDMGSLAAIRKFDEQYGDRRNRRRKAQYGFGVGDGGFNEDSARVRQAPGETENRPTTTPPGASP